MCIHDRHYGDEYSYLSNLFDSRVHFGKNNILKLGNIGNEEKSLYIFNEYSAKNDVFDYTISLDIIKTLYYLRGCKYCFT